MSKAYLFAIFLIIASFTGCIEDDDDDNSPSLRESVNSLINSLDTQKWSTFCSYHLDYQANFMNFTERKECVDEMKSSFDYEEEYGLIGLKTTINDYNADRLDYKASKSSGYVYSVSMYVEQCFIYENTKTSRVIIESGFEELKRAAYMVD